MADRTTKALLLAIAAGLWMNVTAQLLPVAVHAQDDSRIVRVLNSIASDLSGIASDLIGIASDVDSIESDLDDIEDGTCPNGKIC